MERFTQRNLVSSLNLQSSLSLPALDHTFINLKSRVQLMKVSPCEYLTEKSDLTPLIFPSLTRTLSAPSSMSPVYVQSQLPANAIIKTMEPGSFWTVSVMIHLKGCLEFKNRMCAVTVWSCITRSRASLTSNSDKLSNAEVASSKISTDEFW